MGIKAAPPSAAIPLEVRPRLSEAELAVLRTLLASDGKVLGRREIARRSGLADQSERRCDAIMVTLRRVLGEHSIITVRRRGWRLDPAYLPEAATAAAAS